MLFRSSREASGACHAFAFSLALLLASFGQIEKLSALWPGASSLLLLQASEAAPAAAGEEAKRSLRLSLCKPRCAGQAAGMLWLRLWSQSSGAKLLLGPRPKRGGIPSVAVGRTIFGCSFYCGSSATRHRQKGTIIFKNRVCKYRYFVRMQWKQSAREPLRLFGRALKVMQQTDN